MRKAVELGYPQEAFTDDALFWSYVLNVRQKYRDLMDAGYTTNSIRVKNILAQLAVSNTCITEPLTQEQLKSG